MMSDVWGDQRSISSVISIILLVAVATILTAVVGTVVLDLAEKTDTAAPQATFTIETDPETGLATITHQAGKTISVDALDIQGGLVSENGSVDGEIVEAGDSVTVHVTATEIDVVWEQSEGQTGAVLDSFDVSSVGYIDHEILESGETLSWDASDTVSAQFQYSGSNNGNAAVDVDGNAGLCRFELINPVQTGVVKEFSTLYQDSNLQPEPVVNVIEINSSAPSVTVVAYQPNGSVGTDPGDANCLGPGP